MSCIYKLNVLTIMMYEKYKYLSREQRHTPHNLPTLISAERPLLWINNVCWSWYCKHQHDYYLYFCPAGNTSGDPDACVVNNINILILTIHSRVEYSYYLCSWIDTVDWCFLLLISGIQKHADVWCVGLWICLLHILPSYFRPLHLLYLDLQIRTYNIIFWHKIYTIL